MEASSIALVTLTTDFGLKDSYVAEMKAVLLSLCPSVQLVDISHHLPAGDVFHAAQVLRDAVPAFPDHTIHCAVIDPGVGTARRRVVVRVSWEGSSALLVGPDNGLFSLVSAGALRAEYYEITELERLLSPNRLTTFDGRDIFAPAAALLAAGRPPEYFCRRLTTPILSLTIPEPQVFGDRLIGEVIYIDHFGNAVTNLTCAVVEEYGCGEGKVQVVGRELHLVRSYTEIPEGEAAGIFSSRNALELAACGRSAVKLLKLRVGTPVVLMR